MENYNEEQMMEQMLRRQEAFRKMGAPNAGRVMIESAVGSNSMAAKLAAIKSGAAKSEFNKFMNATGKNAPNGAGGANGFDALPEPKIKKNPNVQNETVKPEYSQKLEDFSAPRSSGNQELDAINAMFGGDGGGSSMRTNPNQGRSNDFQMNLDIDSAYMPSFNPHQALAKKAMEMQQQQFQQQNTNPYLKHAQQNSIQQEFMPNSSYNMENQMNNQMGNMNMANFQMMMETIAKGVAEKTMRNILNEFSNQQKSKLQFEYYNREKGIVKGADGKLYKLTPVEVKRKA